MMRLRAFLLFYIFVSPTMLRNLRSKVIQSVTAGVSVVALAEVTTHLPSQGRSSDIYHEACDFATRQILQNNWLFTEEQAHTIAIQAIQYGWAPKYRTSPADYAMDTKVRPFSSSDLTFSSPIGAAAGLDKDGVAISGLFEMGFGFVEIGAVTPLPQPGNPYPRIFRLAEDRAIINRCGFNSKGVDAVLLNLQAFRSPDARPSSSPTFTSNERMKMILHELEKLMADFKRLLLTKKTSTNKQSWIVGLNVGRNKETADEIQDYTLVIRKLGTLVDYIVINVSSPNTPGLRDQLQRKEALANLLAACIQERDASLNKKTPLLVKISPDLTEEEMKDLAQVVTSLHLDGLVISNTTTTRPSTLLSSQNQSGGLSGAPLCQKSTECIRTMYALTKGTIPIIGVGGVFTGQDAYDKLRAGASLIQIYTALTYEGPGVVSRIRNELNDLLHTDGHKSVQDVIGLDHEIIYWSKKKEQLLQKREIEKILKES